GPRCAPACLGFDDVVVTIGVKACEVAASPRVSASKRNVTFSMVCSEAFPTMRWIGNLSSSQSLRSVEMMNAMFLTCRSWVYQPYPRRPSQNTATSPNSLLNAIRSHLKTSQAICRNDSTAPGTWDV